MVSGFTRRASCLFLSPLWPEPGSSAAGVRTEGLLRAFQRWGWDVHYAAASKPNAYTRILSDSGIPVYECGPNRGELLASVLEAAKPSVVVFDRFIAEEAYSFRVRELAPTVLRVLDMQDLHALRKGRQELVESGADPYCVLAHRPPASSDALLRELGAIQRSDLTLVCSPVELELLKGVYGVSPSKLCQASFFCQEAGRDTAAGDYGERAPGVEVGGTDAVAGGAGTPAQASFFCQEAARDAAGDYGASEPGVGVGRTDTAAKDEGAPTTSVAERDDKPTYGERAALVEVGVTDAAAKRAHTSTASIGGSKDPSTAAVAGAIDGQLVDTTQLPPDTPELTPLPRSDQPSAGSDVPPGLGSPLEQASAGPGASPGVGFGYSPRHGFDSRRGFVTIGGFCHAPNVDAVEYLATEIWPRIRARLPRSHRDSAIMRVYGAYPNKRVQALHNPSEGFHICGHAKSLDVLARARVLLAPLRYGAGIKGKIVDAWRYGLPVVTTEIGAEGIRGTARRRLSPNQPRLRLSHASAMPTLTDASSASDGYGEDGLGEAGAGFVRSGGADSAVAELLDIYGDDGLDSGYDVDSVIGGRGFAGAFRGSSSRGSDGATGGSCDGSDAEPLQLEWGGLITSNPDAFASDALTLYLEQEVWEAARLRARSLLRELYSEEENLNTIRLAIEEAMEQLPERRAADFAGALLWQQSARSTEYFSRWIELKEAGKGKVPRGGL